MKYVVILGDGMADRPIPELDGKTPIQAAATPVMDMLAAQGEIGLAKTIPDGMKPGSDTANLAVLGYDPKAYYSGRSPLEALSIGVPMEADDIALRTNIVTIEKPDGKDVPFEEMIITDHSSGEISTEDAAVLLNAVREELENEEFQFYVGTSYRHCLIWKKGTVVELAQPHDHLGEKIGAYLPANFIQSEDPKAAFAAAYFTEMMKKSYEILDHHPLNEQRRKEGKNVANCFWFWGAGTKPALTDFKTKTGKSGAMISAVDLLKGIAVGADMKVVEVEGANGQLETNYEGKAQAALDVLLKEGFDFVYVHVEAPDEMGHQGSVERKVKSIAYLDNRLIRPVYEGLKESGEDFRILIMPDHPTPIEVRTHTSDPVPYILCDSRKIMDHDWVYSEEDAKEAGLLISPGYRIMDRLLEI